MRLRHALAAALACAAATSAAAQPSQPVPRAILDQLVTLVNEREDFPDAATLARFVALSRRPLNGDRHAEYFVRGSGPFCGASGNCREWVFTRGADGGYRLLLDSGGQALTPQATSTRGWRDLEQRGHLSAYESSHVGYQYDGTRYVATRREVREGQRGQAARVAYRVRMPLGARQVALEAVETGAPGVRLSGTYAACATPTPGRLCGTPLLRLDGVRGMSASACATLQLDLADGTQRTLRPRCAVRAGGGAGVALSLEPAEWLEIVQAIDIHLRAPGVAVELANGAGMGLTSFAVEVLEMNGIDPYPNQAS